MATLILVEDLLPTGDGLFAVHTLEQAADAVAAIRGDYARHASAARAIAREHLDSDRVLAGLLADAGIATPSRRS
jgi:hypothetical protein